MDLHQQAFVIARELGDRKAEASILGNRAIAYRLLGQYDKARTTVQQAIKIQQTIGDQVGVSTSLVSLANIDRQQNRNAEAIATYQQALSQQQQLGVRLEQGRTLVGLGLAYSNQNQFQQAIAVLQQALAIAQELGSRNLEAFALDRRGQVHLNAGQLTQALDALQQALTLYQDLKDPEGEADVLSRIAQTLEKQNQAVAAIVFYKQSINTRETIRQGIRTLPRQFQESYTATVAESYRSLASLLLKQNRILEAQQVLDLLKIQELKDYLKTTRGGQKPLYEMPVEQAILKKYQELSKSAIQLGQELNQLEDQVRESKPLTPAQEQCKAELVKLRQDLNAEFNEFTRRQDVVALLNQLTPETIRQTIDLKDLQPLGDDLRRLNAVLLYPLVLNDRLELILTTPNSPAPLRRTVNVKREELNATIVAFRQALQDPDSDPKPLAQKLYSWLIQPLEKDLKDAKLETIIYAPDAQLRYIPLAALYDGKQWLIERYRINNITAKSLTSLSKSIPKQSNVLAGAFVTGKFSVSVGTTRQAFNGLKFAGQEVKTLARLMPNTKTLIDQAFSRSAFTSQMNDYAIVHFATHASFIPGDPKQSFILFGNGETANLKDIEDWTLKNVDLVVLSACETAVGIQTYGERSLGNGEEILGLGYQFQDRGAKATIASLWTVDDGGTQVLMDAFYALLKKGTLTKTEALQQSQIALMKNTRSLQVTPLTQPLKSESPPQPTQNSLDHPYYWAPFILIGNGL